MLSWDKARDAIIPVGHLSAQEQKKSGGVIREGIREEMEMKRSILTYDKSSSDPSPFPDVMSLSDWLSLGFFFALPLLLLPKRRVFRDLSLDFLRPNID